MQKSVKKAAPTRLKTGTQSPKTPASIAALAASRLSLIAQNIKDIGPLTTVGKIRTSHGLKGEVFIILFAKEASWSKKTTSLFITRREPNENHEPADVTYSFEITRLKSHKVGLIVKLEGLDDRTNADTFKGALVQIPAELLRSVPGETVYLKEVEGFEVERDSKKVGKVVGFSSNNAQDLIVVENKDGKFEIPFIPQFVKSIRWQEKMILMDFPDGLLGEAVDAGPEQSPELSPEAEADSEEEVDFNADSETDFQKN